MDVIGWSIIHGSKKKKHWNTWVRIEVAPTEVTNQFDIFQSDFSCIIFFFTYPVTTTTKSIMFQIFLRYAPLCKTNPKATIFSKASTKKITTK